jgi:hypothetical protein
MATIDESGLAAKIRDRPINDRLRRVLLAAAANAGVDVVYVVSGGQPGSSGQRTGSNRHDGGNAADLELIAGGRTLNFTAQGDLAAFCRFVAAAAASGATGIGAGVDYVGPTRLHVGFGNGPRDMAKVVWGAGGAPANAPAWLNEAAAYGWANPAAIPGEAWPPQPAGGEVVASPGESAGAESQGPLQGLPGELVRYSERSDGIFGLFWRPMIALFQLCVGLPASGVADPQTSAALTRYGPFFRFAGALVAAVGVVGLVKSLGGSTADPYLDALRNFRQTLASSADPGLAQAFDAALQVLEAAKPSIENAARAPPFDAILAAAGAIVPGRTGSLVTLAAGTVLHQFGARIVQRRL